MEPLRTKDMSVEAVLFDMIGTTVQEKDSKTIMNCLKLAFEEFWFESGFA